MTDPATSRLMRDDWNQRAREDAYYYVAFGRRGQSHSEFLDTASDVVRSLEAELKRLQPADRRNRRALEIGCGPGRLMLPMSWNFGEIHGVDVSDEMIRRAVRELADVPNAFPRVGSGSDLRMFGDEMFDFVYSYAVFQHIPSAEVVLSYLSEAARVLKLRGILRCQVNGLPKTAKKYTTWSGVRLDAGDIADFAAMNDMQLLALEGLSTQYLWVTMRKQQRGWFQGLLDAKLRTIAEEQPQVLSQQPPEFALEPQLTPVPQESSAAPIRIRSVCNSHSGEPAVPARGRFSGISMWVENLPPDCDLNQVMVMIDAQHEAAPVYIGPPVFDGVCQVNAMFPEGVRTGLVTVELRWLGDPIGEPAWLRVIPPPPRVPRVLTLTDGVDLCAGDRITSRTVKLQMEEVTAPEQVTVAVDGEPVLDLDRFCTDPANDRYEINFTLPAAVGRGIHRVEVRHGKRDFGTVEIEVA